MRLTVPVIARVHGTPIGVGCNFALASDLIVASEDAQFGQVFIKIGLMPDGGSTFFLPHLVGYQKAFELTALGDIISAREAERIGFVNRVVPAPDLDETVDLLARRLIEAPNIALKNIKAALNQNLQRDLAAALEFEAVGQDACFHSPDFIEGIEAFIEKRRPVFNQSRSSRAQAAQ